MTIYDITHKDIIIHCLRNKGIGFDYEDFYSKKDYCWEEKYRSLRILFWCKWVLQDTHIPDHMTKYEKRLKLLPPGVTYKKCSTIYKDERQEKNPKVYQIAHRCFKTRFYIHVSEEFSKKIMQKYDGSRLVIWNYPELGSALDFKKRVMHKHREILNPLFSNGVAKALCLTKSGFTDYDCARFNLWQVGMKPLQDNSQLLGLMIAICEHSLEHIPEDEIWFIETLNSYRDDFDVHVTRYKIQEPLCEW